MTRPLLFKRSACLAQLEYSGAKGNVCRKLAERPIRVLNVGTGHSRSDGVPHIFRRFDAFADEA